MRTDTGVQLLQLLRSQLRTSLIEDPVALAGLQGDSSGARSPAAPLGLVTARTIGEVQTAVRCAAALHVPVVPRGAGTGLAGGAIAGQGALVVSTERMNRILKVNAADGYAVVEAGVLNGQLNEQLRPQHLWWPPDPASKAISTVGGNIATNAGGLLCAKYGVTRDSVLGLTVVLADGTVLHTGRTTVKGVTGYDLTALLVGSEGTLGVIVEAVLKLRPLPAGPVVTIGAYFDSVFAAAVAAAAITAAGLRPAVLELLDAAALTAIGHYLGSASGMPTIAPGGAYLLLQTDDAAAEAEAGAALTLIRESGGTAELSRDPAAAERLFAVRRSAHPAFERLGRVLIEDICVPRSRLAEAFAAIAELSERTGIAIPTVAHAADGNLHPNLVVPEEEAGPEIPERVEAAADELFDIAIRLGGTLTGEHGVGILKRRWLERELGPDSMRLQRGIKELFDPRGILNPGKVF